MGNGDAGGEVVNFVANILCTQRRLEVDNILWAYRMMGLVEARGTEELCFTRLIPHDNKRGSVRSKIKSRVRGWVRKGESK